MKSTKDKSLAYARAGVDIDAADRTKNLIRGLARSTFRPEVLTDIGLFGAFFRFKGYAEPVLVSSADGVGTKLKIASIMGRYDTVGQDLVNHCINDILCCGAEPLFFLDHIAMGKLVPRRVQSIVSGLAKACRESGCALIGGETAEMPGLYAGDDFDLVGFIVGAVEQRRIINGKKIRAGDAVLGLPSSGLHTNGYSLARRVFKIEKEPLVLDKRFPGLKRKLGLELLQPHRPYYSQLKPFLRHIRGLAHITGGGFSGNIPRILPKGLCVHIDKGAWQVPPLFKLIQERGQISESEMYRVFNMGIGMVVICSQDLARSMLAKLDGAVMLGRVQSGDKTPILYRDC